MFNHKSNTALRLITFILIAFVLLGCNLTTTAGGQAAPPDPVQMVEQIPPTLSPKEAAARELAYLDRTLSMLRACQNAIDTFDALDNEVEENTVLSPRSHSSTI